MRENEEGKNLIETPRFYHCVRFLPCFRRYAALQEMAKIQAAGWETQELPWVWGKPNVDALDPDDILE